MNMSQRWIQMLEKSGHNKTDKTWGITYESLHISSAQKKH